MKLFLTVVLLVTLTGALSTLYGQWQKYTIDPSFQNATIVYVADIDGDTDPDAAATSFGSSDVVWYENDGGIPITWTKWTIDANLSGAVGVYIADIDGDDTLDVVATGNGASVVVWYKNEGGTPITWTKYTIDSNLGGAEFVHVDDIDGDTDLDVAAVGFTANDVVWYENGGGTPITWTKRIIDSNLGSAVACHIADIDGDDTLDVVACGDSADDVVWYKNEGGTPISWTKYTIDANLNGAWSTDTGDMDDDTDLDVVATGRVASDVVWYENGGGIPITWTKWTIDANLGDAFVADIADIDLDNDLDVLATGRSANDVVWYENNLPDSNWPKRTIDANLNGANFVFAADIDADSWPDVIATGWNSNNVVWYKNPPVPVELTSFTASTSRGEVFLNWATATELNNLGFEIERKLNSNETNGEWILVGFREGYGTTTEPREYSYVDDISSISASSLAYRLKQIDFDGSYEYSDEVFVETLAPTDFVLKQNYPNPFNPSTTITFGIPVKANVVLKVFNSLGEEVAQLVNNEIVAGSYKIEFDATNLPSGLYFYQLKAGSFTATKKLILLK